MVTDIIFTADRISGEIPEQTGYFMKLYYFLLADPKVSMKSAYLLSYLICIEPICLERYSEECVEYFRVSASFLQKYYKATEKSIIAQLAHLANAGYISIKVRGTTNDKKRYVKIEWPKIQEAIELWKSSLACKVKDPDAYYLPTTQQGAEYIYC